MVCSSLDVPHVVHPESIEVLQMRFLEGLHSHRHFRNYLIKCSNYLLLSMVLIHMVGCTGHYVIVLPGSILDVPV
jgi:hypothetical protein